VVILSTTSPDANPANDVPLAGLIHRVKGPDNPVGTYTLPVTIIVRKTDLTVGN